MWVTLNVYPTESKKMTASASGRSWKPVVQNSEDVIIIIIKENQTEQPLRTKRWWNSESEDRLTDQCETVIGSHQLLDAVLLQHHHPGQHRALGASAVLTVHHVALLTAVLAGHEQQVEHLHLQRAVTRLSHRRTARRACSAAGYSRRIRCSSRPARPSRGSDSRSFSLQPPAALSWSGCVWWTASGSV